MYTKPFLIIIYPKVTINARSRYTSFTNTNIAINTSSSIMPKVFRDQFLQQTIVLQRRFEIMPQQ